MKSQDTQENQGVTMSERTRGATSGATGEILGKSPNRIIGTLETRHLWRPKLTLDQPLRKLPLPSSGA